MFILRIYTHIYVRTKLAYELRHLSVKRVVMYLHSNMTKTTIIVRWWQTTVIAVTLLSGLIAVHGPPPTHHPLRNRWVGGASNYEQNHIRCGQNTWTDLDPHQA